MPMVMDPRLRPISELIATNVKFFESELTKMPEPPSSADAIRATSRTGGQGPLWTTQHQEAPVAYLTRWVAQP